MKNIAFFSVSFILSLIFTPIVRLIAIKNNLISYPRADRWHKQPTAILGRVAICLAAIIPELFTQIVAGCIAIFFSVVLALLVHNLLAIPLTLLR